MVRCAIHGNTKLFVESFGTERWNRKGRSTWSRREVYAGRFDCRFLLIEAFSPRKQFAQVSGGLVARAR